MVDLQPRLPPLVVSPESAASDWERACIRFLESVSEAQQPAVHRLLLTVNGGGAGLRDWVTAIAFRGSDPPAKIPEQVIDVYLADADAMPLHDCENCGLAVPVRPRPMHGFEGAPEHEYFPVCPNCGGRTGPYFYWSRHSGGSEQLRRSNPR